MRTRTKIFLGATLVTFAFLAFQVPFRKLLDQRPEISHETSRIDGPLRSDGTVDYLSAVNAMLAEGVTSENNAVVHAAKAIGFEGMQRDFEIKFLEALGVDALPATDRIKDPYQFVVELQPNEDAEEAHRRLELYDQLMSRPWRSAEYPAWGQWVRVSHDALDLLVAASKQPRYFHPLVTAGDYPDDSLMEALLVAAQSMRQAGRCLAFRAMNSLGAGDVDSAIEDIKSIRRIGDLTQQSVTLIEQLVGIAINGIATQAEQSLLSSQLMSRDQLVEYRSFLETRPPTRGLAERLDVGERYMMLDLLQKADLHGINLGPISDAPSSGFKLSPTVCFFIDWNRAKRFCNDQYDQLVAAAAEPNLHLRIENLDGFEQQIVGIERDVQPPKAVLAMIGGPAARGTWFGKLFCAMLMPAVAQVGNAEVRGATQREMAKFAIALELHRLDHGQYPESLDDPGLPTLPMDPFTGSSIKHRNLDDGFLLYSVGFDGRDDGGVTIEDRPHGSRGFDVPFRVSANPKPAPK